MECLIEKKQKLVKRIRSEMKMVSSNVTLEGLLGGGNAGQVEEMEN